jgi:hypothetical protein
VDLVVYAVLTVGVCDSAILGLSPIKYSVVQCRSVVEVDLAIICSANSRMLTAGVCDF